jgi:Ca-activated chloride channel family protein
MTTTTRPIDRTTPTVATEIRFLKGAVPAAGGRVPALLRVQADAPVDTHRRTAIDLALVLDRSGSMGGEPIDAAKAAAHDAIDLLEDGDRIALVAFANETEIVLPPSVVTDRAPLHRAVEGLYARGGTALHAGWVEGTQQLVDLLDDDRSARVLLLTDGRANVGVTDPSEIARDVAKLKEVGVATSTVGLGRGFQEDLLAGIAEAGGGRFAYAETPADLEGLIAAELIAADATVGRDVHARLQVAGDRATRIAAIGTYREEDGAVVLPELLLGMPLEVPLEVTLRAGDPATDATLGSVTLTWTDAGGQTVQASVPIVADAIEADAYAARDEDADVVVVHVLATAARLYDEAMEALDRRDTARVEARLRDLEEVLDGAPDDVRLARQRARMEQARDAVRRRDDVLARKRMHASSMTAHRRFEADDMSDSDHGIRKHEALRQRKAERDPSWGGGSLFADPSHGARIVESFDLSRPDGATTTLRLLQGDITEVQAEALINPTNTHLHGAGRSVDGAVHRVGGRELTRECRAIGRIGLAQAVATKGHRLPVDYVIHVAVPVYQGSPHDLDLLEKAYAAAFAMVRQMRIGHVTVPALGTGGNGYPAVEATDRAATALLHHLTANDGPRTIDVVLYDASLVPTYAAAIREHDALTRP